MNTTKLNRTTQKANYYVTLYNNSNCNSVDFFYKNCSSEKRRIENTILNRMASNNCHAYRILAGNTCFFTCGYLSQDNNTLFIETKDNIFEIAL